MRRLALALLPLLFVGCGRELPCASGSLPKSFSLSAPGVTVEVALAPLRYTVKDASGRAVLTSLAAGTHDGYGAFGFTTGTLQWDNVVSPGYFSLTPQLDPWRDDWKVAAATQRSPTELDLTLSHAGQTGCIHARLTLAPSTLRVELSLENAPKPRAWSVGFQTPADEAFLGFGERFSRLDERGLNLYSWPEEGGLGKAEGTPPGPDNPYPNGETMTYYPVPFFVSSQGYGFWLDSTWRNEFRLASDRPDAWRVWDIGPTLAYQIFLPIPNDPRPWPQQLVDEFTAKTGRPMIPPKWAFGPRRRINRESMIDGVPEIQAMRDHDLALTAVDDALHFLPAGSEIGIEPSVAAWVKSCTALGLRAECYYNPYISKDPSPLDADAQMGLANGWFLKDASGMPSVVWLISGKFLNLYTVDVTEPAAVNWFTQMFSRALALGYSGWMYDFGEYVQPNVVAGNGMTGEELHNLFPVLYDKAAHDALEKMKPGDWFFFARSGYTGSSAYTPVVWSGDPDASFDDALGLPAMIRAGVNMGLSGVPHWGSDIGGYKCTSGHAAADGELLARWIEFGAIGSDMHDEDACSDAMDTGQKASIWTSPDAQAAWFTYARLHTRLFPYLYTLAIQAHQTGAPTMRALFFEHPDPALTAVDDELYLGPALLAAPVVVRGARSRKVVLPGDSYLDWQDPALYTGPETVTVQAPLGKLPLFLRDGYLVPLLDPTIDTLNDVADPAIVGPADVAGVYDVAGLITHQTGAANTTLYDGTVLAATYTGALAAPAPAIPLASSEAELSTCAACYLVTPGPGFQRARVTMTSGTVTLGGLTLKVKSPRRIRWDLYLAASP